MSQMLFANLETMLEHGRFEVTRTLLNQPYPQPEIDRPTFVRQVKGCIPRFLWQYTKVDPVGLYGETLDNTPDEAEFWFPNQTNTDHSFAEPEPTGVLEAAQHEIRIDIPGHAYGVRAWFLASGPPGKPAFWKAVRWQVEGLEYDAFSLPVALALSTGDYPKGYEVKQSEKS